MALQVLLVFSMILLAAETEQSKRLSTGRSLCLCGDRVLRFQSVDDKESFSVSCDKRCAAEKNAACERIDKCDPRWIVKNLNVTFHDRGSDFGWYAKVSWRPFKDFSVRWRGYCLFYILDAGSPAFINSSFLSKDQTSVNMTSLLSYKRVDLSLVVLPMDGNVTSNDASYIQFKTFTPEPVYVDPSLPFTEQFKTTKSSSRTISYVAISVGSLVGIALVCGFLSYFLLHKKGSIPLPSDFKYHAFIIYSNEDRLWMKGKLLPLLEEKHHLTCCVHYRDFELAIPFRDNMAQSVYKSFKVIALFSTNFLRSNYCMYELDIAIGRLLEKRDRSLVVIRIDGADYAKLPPELKRRSFIDYCDTLERPLWKRKLLQFLGLPDDAGTHDTNEEQNCDNNNTFGFDGVPVPNGNRARVGFNRMESTISNDSEISYLEG